MAANSFTNLTPINLTKPPNLAKTYYNLQSPSISWIGTTINTTLPFTNLSFKSSKSKSNSATVLSSLPTAKPEGASTGKAIKWSWRAIKAFSLAALEARKLKYANTGTESLLMGILIEGTSLASKYLWNNGITLFKVREETIKVVGKADMYYFPPEQPPLTDEAQKALDWAVNHKLKSGDNGEVSTTDILLGIWADTESPGHKVLAGLGFNDEKAKELESLSSGPGFVEGAKQGIHREVRKQIQKIHLRGK